MIVSRRASTAVIAPPLVNRTPSAHSPSVAVTDSFPLSFNTQRPRPSPWTRNVGRSVPNEPNCFGAPSLGGGGNGNRKSLVEKLKRLVPPVTSTTRVPLATIRPESRSRVTSQGRQLTPRELARKRATSQFPYSVRCTPLKVNRPASVCGRSRVTPNRSTKCTPASRATSDIAEL